jgi:hypothetical protein
MAALDRSGGLATAVLLRPHDYGPTRGTSVCTCDADASLLEFIVYDPPA